MVGCRFGSTWKEKRFKTFACKCILHLYESTYILALVSSQCQKACEKRIECVHGYWVRVFSSLVHREKSVIKPKQNIRSSNIGRKFYRFIEMWIEEYNFDFLVFIFVQLFVCLFWCVNSIGDWVWANQVTYIIRIVFFEHSQKCCIVTATIVIHFRGLLLETLDYH